MDALLYLQNNPAQTTIIIGLILLIVEVWVLGISTIVLLALGISAVLVGTLAWVGVIPATVTSLVAVSGIGAGVLTILLWRPLKKSQKVLKREYNIHSDLIGLTFDLESELDKNHPATVRYSGVSWKLVLGPKHQSEQFPAGTKVSVIAVDVGRFIVEPAEEKVDSGSL